MRLECKYAVQAAHQLTAGVPENHPCRRLHGHRYNIAVTIIGDINPDTGMLLEYEQIDERVWEVLKRIDHHNLAHLGLKVDVRGEPWPLNTNDPNENRLNPDIREPALAARVRVNSTVEHLALWLKAELTHRFPRVDTRVGALSFLSPQVYSVRIEEDADHTVEV